MKICILGKYPPIEGGVSANTYWLARGLAQRGHEIHVVTNADEVEEMYRLTLEARDAPWLQPAFEDTGGRVRVYNAEGLSARAMGHIPLANPFVTKLASLATDIVRRHACEAILAYYYEPYAVAGWLVSRWTGRPLIVKHAGSDLDRLFRVPDLATAYKEVLRTANAVVTQSRLTPRFLGIGVARDRLEPDVPYSLPAEVFNPRAEPLDIAGMTIRSAADSEATAGGRSVPVIGAYGKIGISKGTFDLIASLGELARAGLEFRFAAMIGQAQGTSLAAALRQARLESRTDIIPMLPNWRVPSFLRACTAVCFLERDFPVAIHGPIIPREVLACGTCLVVSDEIARKQRYRDRLVSSQNVLIVRDPKDHAELIATLRRVVEDPAWASEVGAQGVEISRTLEDYPAYVGGWEQLLARRIDPSRFSMAQLADVGRHNYRDIVPDLYSYLSKNCGSLVDEFEPEASEDHYRAAIRFCEFASEFVDQRINGAAPPQLAAALAYARERLIAGHFSRTDQTPVFAVVDRLKGNTVSRESVWNLRPVRGNSVRIRAFDYDVSDVGILSSVGGHTPLDSDGADLARIEKSPTLVLFHRSANLIPCELRIDDATRTLLDLCDGSLTTGELVEAVCRHFGVERSPPHEDVVTSVLGALDRLYRAGILAFGEYCEPWGWTGGLRQAEGPLANVGPRTLTT